MFPTITYVPFKRYVKTTKPMALMKLQGILDKITIRAFPATWWSGLYLLQRTKTQLFSTKKKLRPNLIGYFSKYFVNPLIVGWSY